MRKFMGPKIYGTVTMGERGQVIIPVEARKELGIKPKNKLIVCSGPGHNAVVFMPIESMTELLKHMTEIKTKIETEIPKKKR